jgi:predicted DNA-binding transcriptional regulator AlpA
MSLIYQRRGWGYAITNFPSEMITATVPEFSRISGLGQSTVWRMIADQRLQTISVGRRRLVVVDSYRRLIAAQLQGSPTDARRNDTVPPIGSKRRERPSAIGK